MGMLCIPFFCLPGSWIGVLSEKRTGPVSPGKHTIARNQWELQHVKISLDSTECLRMHPSSQK